MLLKLLLRFLHRYDPLLLAAHTCGMSQSIREEKKQQQKDVSSTLVFFDHTLGSKFGFNGCASVACGDWETLSQMAHVRIQKLLLLGRFNDRKFVTCSQERIFKENVGQGCSFASTVSRLLI